MSSTEAIRVATTETITAQLVGNVLVDELKVRQASNPQYSLRAFARDLDLNPADLSKVMRHRKFLSTRTVARLTQVLNLDASEARVLVMSASLRELEGVVPAAKAP